VLLCPTVKDRCLPQESECFAITDVTEPCAALVLNCCEGFECIPEETPTSTPATTVQPTAKRRIAPITTPTPVLTCGSFPDVTRAAAAGDSLWARVTGRAGKRDGGEEGMVPTATLTVGKCMPLPDKTRRNGRKKATEEADW
jgi:hypothetical protein